MTLKQARQSLADAQAILRALKRHSRPNQRRIAAQEAEVRYKAERLYLMEKGAPGYDPRPD